MAPKRTTRRRSSRKDASEAVEAAPAAQGEEEDVKPARASRRGKDASEAVEATPVKAEEDVKPFRASRRKDAPEVVKAAPAAQDEEDVKPARASRRSSGGKDASEAVEAAPAQAEEDVKPVRASRRASGGKDVSEAAEAAPARADEDVKPVRTSRRASGGKDASEAVETAPTAQEEEDVKPVRASRRSSGGKTASEAVEAVPAAQDEEDVKPASASRRTSRGKDGSEAVEAVPAQAEEDVMPVRASRRASGRKSGKSGVGEDVAEGAKPDADDSLAVPDSAEAAAAAPPEDAEIVPVARRGSRRGAVVEVGKGVEKAVEKKGRKKERVIADEEVGNVAGRKKSSKGRRSKGPVVDAGGQDGVDVDEDDVDGAEAGSDDPDSGEAAGLAKAKEEALAALFGSSTAAVSLVGEVEKDALDGPPVSPRKRGRRRDDSADASASASAVRKEGEGPASGGEGDGEAEGVFDYVTDQVEVPEEFGEFSDVLARFAASGQPSLLEVGEEDLNDARAATDGDGLPKNFGNGERLSSDDENGRNDGGGGDEDADAEHSTGAGNSQSGTAPEVVTEPLSERQARRRKRLTVAQLKALVPDPGVVEQWDVTATDPLLLVHLKSVTDAVAVPTNWRQKRKYLQGKRGMEKLPFKMPQFIIDTGICAARDALAEADAAKTAKQKGRERIRPKSNANVDIDYGAMRDAFFKFQTKPRLTEHGDLYFELREREVQHDKFRPGVLSATLREALGIGPNDPPPWLVAMQRYGPPRSYPGLEIAGLTCPIPAGALFGYQRGGWGKPPVDENGRPLYGDVFGEGAQFGAEESKYALSTAEKERLWGEPEPVEDSDGDEEDAGGAATRKRHRYNRDVEEVEDEDDEAAKNKSKADKDEAAKAADSAATAAADAGVASVQPGVETPASGIELRKGLAPGQLYSVLEQKEASVGKGVMGSSHVYKLGTETEAGTETANEQTAAAGSEKTGDALLKKRKVGPGDENQRAKKAKEASKAQEFKF